MDASDYRPEWELPTLDRIEEAVMTIAAWLRPMVERPAGPPPAGTEWERRLADFRSAERIYEAAIARHAAVEAHLFRTRKSRSAPAEALAEAEATEARADAQSSAAMIEADTAAAALVRAPAPTLDAVAEKLRVAAVKEFDLTGDILAAITADLERLASAGYRQMPVTTSK